jgi:hypothetical protein
LSEIRVGLVIHGTKNWYGLLLASSKDQLVHRVFKVDKVFLVYLELQDFLGLLD